MYDFYLWACLYFYIAFVFDQAEKKCSTKAAFPDVYREFEELHSMVKKMCQDYFNNSELKQPLEIKNHKVSIIQIFFVSKSFLSQIMCR